MKERNKKEKKCVPISKTAWQVLVVDIWRCVHLDLTHPIMFHQICDYFQVELDLKAVMY